MGEELEGEGCVGDAVGVGVALPLLDGGFVALEGFSMDFNAGGSGGIGTLINGTPSGYTEMPWNP